MSAHPSKLPYNAKRERETAQLRGFAALLLIPSSIALWYLSASLVPRAFAVLGLFFGILWTLAGLRAGPRSRTREDWYLEATNEGLVIYKGEPALTLVWSEIALLEIDEEKLKLRIRPQQGPDALLEPVWGDLGLIELHRWLEARRPSVQAEKDG